MGKLSAVSQLSAVSSRPSDIRRADSSVTNSTHSLSVCTDFSSVWGGSQGSNNPRSPDSPRTAAFQSGRKGPRRQSVENLATGSWYLGSETSFLHLDSNQLEHVDDDGLADLDVQMQSCTELMLSVHNNSRRDRDANISRDRSREQSRRNSVHAPLEQDFHTLLAQLGKQHDQIVSQLQSECASLKSRVEPKQRRSAESQDRAQDKSLWFNPVVEELQAADKLPGDPRGGIESAKLHSPPSIMIDPGDQSKPVEYIPSSSDSATSASSTAFQADDSARVAPTSSNSDVFSACSTDSALFPLCMLHELWRPTSRGLQSARMTSGYVNRMQTENFVLNDELKVTNFVVDYNGCLAPFIGLPTSKRRIVWDLIGGVLILYDMITIPLRVFDMPDTSFTVTMDWIGLGYWTLNVFATLTGAYVHKDGQYETRPMKIFINYLKFWFWVDLLVVAPDWIFTLVKAFSISDDLTAGSSVKLFRVLRAVRILRLLRLTKLRWIMATIKDIIDSEVVDIVFTVIRMILCLLFGCHLVGCAWFFMASFDVGHNWVSHHHFDSDDWFYQYLTSFHWSITQFTPASMHVQPQNQLERTFAIIVVVVGIVSFSYIVGTITGSLTELRRMKEEATKQFWRLRRFLKKNGVSLPLRLRIEKYLEHAWYVQKSSANSSNLPLLGLLTEQLSNELKCAMSLPHLRCHPLFDFLGIYYNFAMQRIATKALSRKLMNRKEVIFEEGDLAQHMSFVAQGKLRYCTVDPESGEYHEEIVRKDEDWITEPAMWSYEWLTKGTLMAEVVSDICDCDAREFADAVKRSPQTYERVCTYAANFITWFYNQKPVLQADVIQGDICGGEITTLLTSRQSEDESPKWSSDDENDFGPKEKSLGRSSETARRVSMFSWFTGRH